MIDTDKWIESAKVSLGKLEKEVKRLREVEIAFILGGYGLCDNCNCVVCGEVEGWYDHSIHGELTVCSECSDVKGDDL